MTAAFRRYVSSLLAALGLKAAPKRQPVRKADPKPRRIRPWGEMLEHRLAPAVFNVSLLGDDLTGNGSAATPYRTLQRAIDQAAFAADGADTINVAGGLYNQAGVDLNVSVPNSANITTLSLLGGWNNGFTLRDPSATPTTLAPQTVGGLGVADFSILDANTTVDGFRFQFGAGGLQTSNTNSVRLFGNAFTRIGPSDAAGAALVAYRASTVNVLGSQLIGNTFDGGTGIANSNGLILEGSGGFRIGNAVLTDNVFANASGAALRATNAANLAVLGGSAANGGAGVSFFNVASSSLTNVTLTGNAGAALTVNNAAPGVNDLTLSNLTIVGNGSGGSLTNVNSLDYTASAGAAADSVALTPTSIQLTRDGAAQQAVGLNNLGFIKVFLGAGNDEIIFETAVYNFTILQADGQGDTDTVAFNATAGSDLIVVNGTTIAINGAAPPVQGAILQLLNFEQYAVNGLAGNDIFIVEATGGAPVILRGDADDDSFDLGVGGSMDGLALGLTVDGGAGSNFLNFNDQNDASGNSYVAGGGLASRNGAFTATYANIGNLTLNGGAGADDFTVTPDGQTVFTVSGGLPNLPASPGDTLNLNLAGAANPRNFITGPGDGIFNFDNALPVGYLSIETLNTGATPYDLVLDLNFTIWGNDGVADRIRASADASGTSFILERQGDLPFFTGVFFSGAMSSVRSFRMVGSTDDDVLTIQETAGGLPTFAGTAPGSHLNAAMQEYLTTLSLPTNVGLGFDGGLGANTLRFGLTTLRGAQYFADADAAARSGNVNLGVTGGGGSALRASFSGLAPVEFIGAGGELVVDNTALSGADTLTVSDDAIAGDGVSQVTSDNPLFETVQFSGYDSLRVLGGTGGQTLVMDGLDGASSTTLVTLEGGDTFGTDVGGDFFFVRQSAAGVQTVLLGQGGNDTMAVGDFAGVVDNVQGAVIADGGAGFDILVFNDAGSVAGGAYTFANNTVQKTGAGLVSYLTTEELIAFTSLGADQIDILSSLATTPIFINAGAGDDIFNVSSTAPGLGGNLDGIQGDLDLDGGADDNFLNVSDFSGATANANVLIDSASIQGFAGAADQSRIAFANLAELNLFGSDTVGEGFTLLSPNAVVNLFANGGADTVNVVSLLQIANLDGGAGLDTFNLGVTLGGAPGNLDSFFADVNVQGGAGANALNVFDTTTATANANALIGAAAITGLAGPTDNRTINYLATGGSFSQLRVDGSDNAATAEVFSVLNPNGPLLLNLNAGNDTANLQQLTNPANVNGGAGNDTFNLGLAGLLDGLAQPITLDGGTGTNVINLNDFNNAIGRTFGITGALLTRDGGIQVNYAAVQTVTLNAGVGSDTINLTPAAATAFFINGNLPAFPASPGDTLNLDLAGTANAALNLTDIGGGNFTFGNRQTVTYTSIESLNPANGTIDLVLDLNNFVGWGNDGVADIIEARLNGAGTGMELARLGAAPDFIGLFFSIPVAIVRSFTMRGSSDADTLIVRETAGGLLGATGGFTGSALGSHLNGTMQQFLTNGGQPTNVALQFDGGPGAAADRLRFVLTSVRNAHYFADRQATAGSGNVNLGAAGGGAASALRASFSSLTPVDFVGAGGAFFVDATSFSTGGEVFTLQDDAVAGDGVSQLVGPAAFETANFSGYGSFRFTAGNFGETLVYAGVDSAAPPATVILDGDNFFGTEGAAGTDTFNIPLATAGVALTLLGGGGNDTFNLGATAAGAPNNLNAFANNVLVDGQAGANVLNVFDNTSAAGNANVVIGFATITGIAGLADAAVINYTATGGSFSLIRVDGSDTVGDQIFVQNPNGPLLLNGNGGNDVLTVNTLTQTAALNGGAGADTFNFGQAGSVDGITGAISVDGGAGTNVINVNDNNNAIGQTFNLTPTAITRSGGFNVTYAAIATATLNAGTGSDTFTATPSAATTYFINGNLPVFPAAPGDQLTVDLTGVAGVSLNLTGIGDGNFTSTNRQTVFYTSIETIDAAGGQFDLILDLNLTPFGNDGIADLIEARLRAGATGVFELARLGSPPAYVGLLFAGQAAAIRSLAVLGSTDADTFRIREVQNLLPGQTGGFAGVAPGSHLNSSMQFFLNSVGASTNVGIHFDGGPGAAGDKLQLQLTSSRTARYFADAVADARSGNVNLSGTGSTPASDLRLSFASLTPIDFLGAGGELIVDNTAISGMDLLTVADDAVAGDGVSQVTSDNPLFETAFFSGYDAVTVLGGTGRQSLVMNGLDSASTTTLVTLDGDNTFGTDVANDALFVLNSAAAVATRLFGRAGDDLLVVGGVPSNVDNVLGSVLADGGAGTDILLYDDSLSFVAGVYTITNSTVQKAGRGLTTYTTVESLGVDTSQADDRIDILSTLATTPVSVEGNDGSDTYNVCSTAPSLLGNLDGIQGALNLNAGAGANILNVSDFGGLTANANVFITSTQILGFAGSADQTTIDYSGNFAQINLDGADAVGERFTILDPNGPLDLDTFGGADQVFVVAINFIASIDTGAADDLVVVSSTPLPYPFPGDLDDINATLSLEGGAGLNTFNLNDQTTATANANVFITTTQFLNFAGAADDQVVNYASTGGQTYLLVAGSDNAATPEVFTLQRPGGQLDLHLLAGNDTANVQGIDFLANVDAGAGDDQLNVGSTTPSLVGNLDQINATLNLEAGLGANILRVTDQTTATANAGVVITVNQLSGFAGAADGQLINYLASGGSFSLIQVEGADAAAAAEDFTILSPNGPLTLNLNGGPDTARVRSLTTQATVNGGAGDDTLIASSTGLPTTGNLNLIDAPLALNAGAGNNVIHLVDFDGAPNPNVVFTDSAVTGLMGPTNNQVVTYSFTAGAGNSLAINVQLSNLGADWFTVNGTLAGSVATIFGNGGDDEFLVNSTPASSPGRMNLFGGAGNEEFAFANGASLANGFIDGGAGLNQMNYVAWTTGVTVNLTTGVATGLDPALTGGRIAVGTIQNLIGGAGDDFIIGDFQANRLEGRQGNNRISGEAGDDILVGGTGNDQLVGSVGNDLIYGGGGRDAMYGDYVRAGSPLPPIPGSTNSGPGGVNVIVLDSCNDLRQGQSGAIVVDIGGGQGRRGKIVVARKDRQGNLVGPIFVRVGRVTLGPLLPYLTPRYNPTNVQPVPSRQR